MFFRLNLEPLCCTIYSAILGLLAVKERGRQMGKDLRGKELGVTIGTLIGTPAYDIIAENP